MLYQSIKQILEEKNFFSLLGYGLLIPFNLLWIKASGKKTLLKRKGDFSKAEEIKKYIDRGLNLEIDSDLQEDWVLKTMAKFSELLEIEESEYPHPDSIQNWRRSFIKDLIPTLWEENNSVSKVDLCFAVGTFFNNLSKEEEEDFLKFPIEIQRKNYLSASYGVVVAIILGYTNIQFLKDYFKVLLFLDYPFCLNMWSETQKSFIIEEWNRSPNKDTMSPSSRLKMKANYLLEVRRAKEKMKAGLNYKSVAKYLEFSFEKLDGSGFPAGLYSSEMSDLDAFTVFLYHRFSFDEDMNDLSKAGLLKELMTLSPEFKKVNLSERVERMINSSIENIRENNESYLAISGL